MPINVMYFGTTKPGPSSKPVYVGPKEKMPFNRPMVNDWFTGKKHPQLTPEQEPEEKLTLMSFWPRLRWDVDTNDWLLCVRKGYRWKIGEAPELLSPEDEDEDEWEFPVENGKAAFLSFDLTSGEWDQDAEDGPEYGVPPMTDADKRVFVFGTTVRESGYKDEPELLIGEPGNAVVGATALDPALLGIVIDNANQRVQVLGRRATLHRYGDTPLHWTAANTYLTYADMGAVGDHLITMELDPDVSSTAAFVIYDSGDASPKPVRARLYTITLTEVPDSDPVRYTAAIKPPIHGIGDINIIPLFGDHPVEEEEE